MMISDDVLHNLDFLRGKANRGEEFLRNGWPVFFLGLAVVVSVLFLRYPDAYVMQKRRRDHNIRVKPRTALHQLIGMVQHAQGMFNATVVAAEVPNQNTRQFGTKVFHIFSFRDRRF